MKKLPLYASPPLAIIQTTDGANVDRGCKLCSLHELSKPRNVCMGAEGDSGGLLVIGEFPLRDEDMLGIPFSSGANREFRKQVSAMWSGPIAFDNALRCPSHPAIKPEKSVEECRKYLAETLREVAPKRIIAVGSYAAQALMGRSIYALMQRRSYAFLPQENGPPIPVFFLSSPGQTSKNRFLRTWANADLAWALAFDPPIPPWDATVHVVETVRDAEIAIGYLRSFERVAFDCETAGLMYDPSFRVVALSLAAEKDDSRDSFLWSSEALRNPEVVEPLKQWLVSPALKSGQNVVFDIQAVWLGLGVWPNGIDLDSRLVAKLLDPERFAPLDKLAEGVGMGGMKLENAAAKERVYDAVAKIKRTEVSRQKALLKNAASDKKAKVPDVPPALSTLGADPSLERLIRDPDCEKEAWVYGILDHQDRDVMHRYNARDSVATALLCEKYECEIADMPPIHFIWKDLVSKASDAVAQIEAWGIPCDLQALDLFDRHLERQQKEYTAVLDGHFPGVNWASVPQLRTVLFDRLGLPKIKLTDTGLDSTDGDVLQQLASQHPIVATLVLLRKANKLRGTYASGMRPHVRQDGRIHAHLLISGTATGRCSSADPNLQNIVRAESLEGKMARGVFSASPGHTIVQLDFSQLELRIAALLSRDQVMTAIFKSGEDYHLAVAKKLSHVLWGIRPDQVEKKHRSAVKPVSFGILYGKTAGTFARELNISFSEAQKLIDAVLGEFKGLAKWCKERLAESRKTGESWTEWRGQRARRRLLWKIADPIDGIRINAENSAVNSPVQGGGSDYLLASIIESVKWLRQDGIPAKLCVPVHDSMLFEVRNDKVDLVARKVKEIMESWPSGAVPMVADVEIGPNWGALEKISTY